MRKPLLLILRILGSVFTAAVMIVLCAVAIVYYGGDPVIRMLAQTQGSALLARTVSLGEQFHVAWGLPLRILADDVHVANADWGTGPDMFAAQHVEIVIDPLPLLKMSYSFPRISLVAPKVLIETSKDGKGNWSFTQSAATPKTRTEFPSLNNFEVKDGSFTFHNGETNATTLITFSDLSLKTPDQVSPVDVALAGTFQHEPYKFAVRVGPLEQLQSTAQPYPVRIDGDLARTKLGIDGTIADPIAFEGLDVKLAVEGANLQDFLKVFTIPVPETPPYRLAGRLRHDGATWAIGGVDGRMGASRLTGDIFVDPSGKVPYIKAKLASPLMDLADFKGFYGGEPERKTQPDRPTTPAEARAAAKKQTEKADPTGRVIPDTAIPLDQLTKVNSDLILDGERIKPTAGIPFERVKLVMSLKDGALELKPLDFDMAGGSVSARLTLASTARPAKFHGDFEVRHIDIRKFVRNLDAMGQFKESTGIFGGFVKFDSVGASPRDLLGNMDGDFGFFMEGGQFSELLIHAIGLDVYNAAATYLMGDKPVPIACLATRFKARDGIATATTFLLDTSESTILGQGNINFRDETLNLRILPQPKEWSPLSLRSPIFVTGAMASPSVMPELKTVLGKLGAAVALGAAAGPLAELPLLDLGADVKGGCAIAFAAQKPIAGTDTRPTTNPADPTHPTERRARDRRR